MILKDFATAAGNRLRRSWKLVMSFLALLVRRRVTADRLPRGDRHRAPQEPHRLCLPPGIPDATPFSYTTDDSESDEP